MIIRYWGKLKKISDLWGYLWGCLWIFPNSKKGFSITEQHEDRNGLRNLVT